MSALKSLPSRLDSGQIEMLRDLLAVPHDPGRGLSPLAFNGIKNAAADLLVRQVAMPADLVQDFIAMAEDETYDEIWRDYCLQMLPACHERLMERNDPGSADARGSALDALRRASSTRLHTWAGTALLGLDAASRLDPAAVSPGEVVARSVAMASDYLNSEAARITALRVAGLHRAPEARAVAWELAQAADSELLRAAAIATLGDVGGEAAEELLRTLAGGADAVQARIAANALGALVSAQDAEGRGF